MTKRKERRCNFCGKSSLVVRCMISGPPDTHICNECVDACAEIVEEKIQRDEMAAWRREVPERIMAFAGAP